MHHNTLYLTMTLHSDNRWLRYPVLAALVTLLVVGLVRVEDGGRHSAASPAVESSHHVNEDEKDRHRRLSAVDQVSDTLPKEATGSSLLEEWYEKEDQRRSRRLALSDQASAMLQKLQTARDNLTQHLIADYGTYHKDIFFGANGTTIGRTLFQGPHKKSWDRFKRKMMMKLLKGPLAATPVTDTQFVWATGGHSASAGHGNLFSESYTQVLQRQAAAMFDAVGLQFVARPYAMGGTSCGNQVAICSKEIFGPDIDFLSWDYGMTTGHAIHKVYTYFYRASLSSNRPAFLMLDAGGRYEGVVAHLEKTLGLSIFDFGVRQKEDIYKAKFPDSEDLTDDQLQALPKYVRGFRCGNSGVEKGKNCADTKYTMDKDPKEPCNNRKYRVNWHPGWKVHGFFGNMLTLFLTEIIQDSLEALKSDTSGDVQALLKKLQAEDDEDYKLFTNATLSSEFSDPDLAKIADVPADIIYKKPNLCHTAILPADIRYQGVLTETDDPEKKKGSFENYDEGFEFKTIAGKNTEELDRMPVGYDEGVYQKGCTKYRLLIDYQNFFLANSLGESKLVLPNPSEMKYYQVSQQPPFEGYIAMCLARCGWSCPANVVGWDKLVEGQTELKMTVNGDAVTGFSTFGDDCALLKHSNGHKWKRGGDDSQFEFRMKTLKPATFLRLSALVMW